MHIQIIKMQMMKLMDISKKIKSRKGAREPLFYCIKS